MPKTLTTQNTYQKLVLDISDIYEKAELHTFKEANKIIVRANWKIGERIVIAEQSGNLRAKYGSKLLENISRDLTLKYGSGFSVSNLKNMRQLYICYPISQSIGELSWTKYQLLLTINDQEKRRFFETKAIKKGWSVSQLKEYLRVAKIVITSEKKPKAEPAEKLRLVRGRLYTYRLIRQDDIQTTQGGLLVDCGFNFWRDLELAGISDPKEKDIVGALKTAQGYRFKPSDANKKQLYTFKALVQRVTDADTIWVYIDLGFRNWTRQKLRFRGIDAPEVSTKRGQRAKRFVEQRLSQVPFVIIKSHSLDKYGRPLSDIFYLKGESDPQKVLQQGVFLNQELLDVGLAKILRD